MWKLLMLILCVPTPNACLPHQELGINDFDNHTETFPSQAACLERRDLIREQANAFVLSVDCYRVVSSPIVRMK